MLRVTDDHLRRGLALFETMPRLGAFDAVLAAAAAAVGAVALVSADSAFAAVPDIAHTVPDARGAAGLLGDS